MEELVKTLEKHQDDNIRNCCESINRCGELVASDEKYADIFKKYSAKIIEASLPKFGHSDKELAFKYTENEKSFMRFKFETEDEFKEVVDSLSKYLLDDSKELWINPKDLLNFYGDKECIDKLNVMINYIFSKSFHLSTICLNLIDLKGDNFSLTDLFNVLTVYQIDTVIIDVSFIEPEFLSKILAQLKEMGASIYDYFQNLSELTLRINALQQDLKLDYDAIYHNMKKLVFEKLEHIEVFKTILHIETQPNSFTTYTFLEHFNSQQNKDQTEVHYIMPKLRNHLSFPSFKRMENLTELTIDFIYIYQILLTHECLTMLESLKMLNVHYSKPELDSANYEEFDELVDVTQNRMIPSINHLKKLETLKINLLALPEKNRKIIFDWFVLELPKTLKNIILDEGDFKGGYLIEPIVLAYPDMEILNLSQCKIPANTDLNIFAKLNNAKIITLPCIEHRKFAFSNDIKILAINCVARSSSHHPDHKFHNWKNEFLDDPNSTKADQIHRFEDHMSRVGNNISYRMIEEKCTCSRLKAPFKHTVIKYNQNGYIINFFLSEITNWEDVMENIKLL